ncbi:MAG: hypothetical protein GY814_02200, partial [Gammaproteobacteria bacterium]|nr:hypothetical protein [Gammaproteobacteria bacterium]
MSFSYSNSVITQSGTDSSLSGLSGLTGVESWVDGTKKCYRIDDAIVDKLKLDGDLTWDSDYECLFLDEHVKVIQSGPVQIGISKTKNGKEYYSRGLGLVINDLGGKQNTSNAAWWCLNDSSFTTRGGVIDLGANIFFGTSTVSSATINQHVAVDIDGTEFNSLYTSDSMHFLRFCVNPTTIDVNNIEMAGSAGSITPFSSQGFNSFSATIRNGTFNSDGNEGQA